VANEWLPYHAGWAISGDGHVHGLSRHDKTEVHTLIDEIRLRMEKNIVMD
jgi:hypothetical protein